MKKLILPIGLALSLLCQQAAFGLTQVFTLKSGVWNATNLFAFAARINSVKIDMTTAGAGAATNLTYALIDTPVTAGGVGATNGWGPIALTNLGYASVLQFTTNITKTITNFAGLGQTTFPAGSTITNIITISNALVTVTNAFPGYTNVWRRIAVGTVGSNAAVTFLGPFTVNFGLGVTNNSVNADIALTIDYDPSL